MRKDHPIDSRLPAPAPHERKSRAWVAPVLASVFASALAVLVWSPSAIGVFFDDGIYVLLGKAIASGEGLRYTGVTGEPPAAKYPPLYPLLLAGVWKLGPPFPASAPHLKAVGVVITVAAAGAFAWYVQRVLRFPRWFAVVVTAAVWTTVDVWRYAVVPLSEPLFLLTLVLGLAAAARVEHRPDSPLAAILLLAAFGAACYTRTIGIITPLAAVCSLLLARRWRSAFFIAAGALLVIAPWLAWTRWAAGRVSPHLADVLGGYGLHLTAQIRLNPAGYVLGLAGRAAGIGRRVLDVVLPGVADPVQFAVAPLLVALAGFGLAMLWRRSPTTVLAVMAYLGVLCLWPFVARRLLAPIAPWLVLSVAAGFYDVYQRASRRARVRAAVRVLAIGWAVAFTLASMVALHTRQHDGVHVSRSVRLLWAVQAVGRTVPPAAVVVAPEFWAALHLYTGRTVAPSGRFRPVATAEARWGTPAEQLALWDQVGAEYVLLEFGAAVHGDALAVIQQRCGAAAVQLVASSDGMDLVRLVLDDPCRAALGVSARPRARSG